MLYISFKATFLSFFSESGPTIMKFYNLVLTLASLAHLVLAQTQWPIHNNTLNSVVEWDHYSYIIKGQRLFIWSGEVHALILKEI